MMLPTGLLRVYNVRMFDFKAVNEYYYYTHP
jgi:hypothetical protein